VEPADEVIAGIRVGERSERLDDRRARDLAGGMPADPVGDREQARAGVEGVLVVGPDRAGVAPGGVSQD
jgi:hypothetical protein